MSVSARATAISGFGARCISLHGAKPLDGAVSRRPRRGPGRGRRRPRCSSQWRNPDRCRSPSDLLPRLSRDAPFPATSSPTEIRDLTGAAFFGALYPIYVRGLAYSQLGRPRDAATEFQTILDHPGLVLNDPVGPMARLQLARAWSAAGDRARSAAVYADLLTLWKDADPDTPVVRQATAECAGLQ